MNAWDFLFGYNIKECGISNLGITSKNVVNDFFFLFFQLIILDAIIFLLFLLNEKFCHLILEYLFVLIRFAVVVEEWLVVAVVAVVAVAGGCDCCLLQ